MSVSEEVRHKLYRWVEESAGPEVAAGLMEYLPPVGWADVATRRDLDHLESTLRTEIGAGNAGLRAELATVAATFQRELRQQLLATMAFNTTLVGIAVALVS